MNISIQNAEDKQDPAEGLPDARVGSTTYSQLIEKRNIDMETTGNLYLTPPCPGSAPPGTKIEGMPSFPESLSEPFAAVLAPSGSDRLVHLSVAAKLQSRRGGKRKFPNPPAPFSLEDGQEVPHLPRYDSTTPKVTAAELEATAKAHPGYKMENCLRQFGITDFLVQIERARDYLRGPKFWKLRPHRLGRSAYWMKHRAEEHTGGNYRGYISEMSLIVAALLDGIRHRLLPSGENAVIFR